MSRGEDNCYLYLITNTVNEKAYIGISSNPSQRFSYHGSLHQARKMAIARAIRKHGKSSFQLQVLANGSRSYCEELEKKAIVSFKTAIPSGYNIAKGGQGCSLVPSSVMDLRNRKISDALTGRPLSDDHKSKIAATLRGRALSEVTKQKLSAVLKGRAHSEEHKQKISLALANKPKVKTEGRIAGEIKHSETLRKKWQDPEFREMMMAARRKKVQSHE